jgi:hypothetical protein
MPRRRRKPRTLFRVSKELFFTEAFCDISPRLDGNPSSRFLEGPQKRVHLVSSDAAELQKIVTGPAV